MIYCDIVLYKKFEHVEAHSLSLVEMENIDIKRQMTVYGYIRDGKFTKQDIPKEVINI